MWTSHERPRVEVSPGFLLLLGALFWLDEGVGLLVWGLLACLLHELGHVAAALAFGGRGERLALTVGGAELGFSYSAPLSYGQDSLVALAGPAGNLLAGSAAMALNCYLPAVLSFGIGVVNLLPIPPLDGGRGFYNLPAEGLGPGGGRRAAGAAAGGPAGVWGGGGGGWCPRGWARWGGGLGG